MKVKADRAVRYGGETHPTGQEFDMTREDYEQHKDILTITEEETTTVELPDLPEGKQQPESLTDLTAAELKEMAKEKNIEGYNKMNKYKLVEALEALEADASGGSGDTENPPADPGTGQE